MKERPLLFSAPMVRATLEGRKTKTRRTRGLELINLRPDDWMLAQLVEGKETTLMNGREKVREGLFAVFTPSYPGPSINEEMILCPYGKVGDQLWIREAWAVHSTLNKTKPNDLDHDTHVYYRADPSVNESHFVWRPSIHMPRWASRIILEVMSVHVERVKDISRADCVHEGLHPTMRNDSEQDIRVRFKELWNSINHKRGYGWDANPFVWVIVYKVVQP